MDYVARVMSAVMYLFQMELDIFGHQVTFWQVFCFDAIVCTVLAFIFVTFFSD